MSGRIYYLDSPDEIGSLVILRELGVNLNPKNVPDFLGQSHRLSRSHLLCKERKSHLPVVYKVASNHVYIG